MLTAVERWVIYLVYSLVVGGRGEGGKGELYKFCIERSKEIFAFYGIKSFVPDPDSRVVGYEQNVVVSSG